MRCGGSKVSSTILNTAEPEAIIPRYNLEERVIKTKDYLVTREALLALEGSKPTEEVWTKFKNRFGTKANIMIIEPNDSRIYAYFGNGSTYGYVELISSPKHKGAITVVYPPSKLLQSEPLFWQSKRRGSLAYLLVGTFITREYLTIDGVVLADVTFNELLRGLAVIRGDKENVFVASYAGITKPSERYAVVGSGNDKSSWREIPYTHLNQLDEIKSGIQKLGYKAAILEGQINVDKEREPFDIRGITILQPKYTAARLNHQP